MTWFPNVPVTLACILLDFVAEIVSKSLKIGASQLWDIPNIDSQILSTREQYVRHQCALNVTIPRQTWRDGKIWLGSESG